MTAKNFILLIAMFLLTSTLAFGQYGGGPYGRGDHDRRPPRVTVSGCLYGGGGQYVLLDRFGNAYEVRGRTAGFDFFVDHHVRLTGRSRFRPDSPYGRRRHRGGPVLRVEWVEHVTHRTCEELRAVEHERRRREEPPGLNIQIPIP